MAFKVVSGIWRCTAKSIQKCQIPYRSIIIPPNVGEPTRTNQEVIQALTQAIIGGMQLQDVILILNTCISFKA